jgi:hypothetical protein
MKVLLIGLFFAQASFAQMYFDCTSTSTQINYKAVPAFKEIIVTDGNGKLISVEENLTVKEKTYSSSGATVTKFLNQHGVLMNIRQTEDETTASFDDDEDLVCINMIKLNHYKIQAIECGENDPMVLGDICVIDATNYANKGQTFVVGFDDMTSAFENMDDLIGKRMRVNLRKTQKLSKKEQAALSMGQYQKSALKISFSDINFPQ